MKIAMLAVSLVLLAAVATVAAADDPNFVDGPCGGSISPEPDPCLAAQGLISFSWTYHLVNAQTFKNWSRDNPGELARFKAFLQAPTCPTPAHPAEPAMRTMLGMSLVNVVEAYACAKGTEGIRLPAPNPPAGKGDKTPPSKPGAITVTEP